MAFSAYKGLVMFQGVMLLKVGFVKNWHNTELPNVCACMCLTGYILSPVNCLLLSLTCAYETFLKVFMIALVKSP
jgi:hypothetical protein